MTSISGDPCEAAATVRERERERERERDACAHTHTHTHTRKETEEKKPDKQTQGRKNSKVNFTCLKPVCANEFWDKVAYRTRIRAHYFASTASRCVFGTNRIFPLAAAAVSQPRVVGFSFLEDRVRCHDGVRAKDYNFAHNEMQPHTLLTVNWHFSLTF